MCFEIWNLFSRGSGIGLGKVKIIVDLECKVYFYVLVF